MATGVEERCCARSGQHSDWANEPSSPIGGREGRPWDRLVAERVLLPAIRAAPAASIILANGFSCREQIEQLTGRATTHVAELLAA